MVRYVNFYLSRDHRDARGTGCPVAALSADLPRWSPWRAPVTDKASRR